MALVDTERVKKLKRGELAATIATVFCGVALVYFIVGFSVGASLSVPALRLSALIAAPVLTAAGAAVAAFCNIKYGGALDRLIKDYIRDVLVENAAAMHPERDSLTFYIFEEGAYAEIKVNSFKEKIVFDFSPFGKLSPVRRSFIASALVEKLSLTFCRLAVERGVNYKSVGYTAANGRKKGRQIYIIANGVPEKRALKNYYKSI